MTEQEFPWEHVEVRLDTIVVWRQGDRRPIEFIMPINIREWIKLYDEEGPDGEHIGPIKFYLDPKVNRRNRDFMDDWWSREENKRGRWWDWSKRAPFNSPNVKWIRVEEAKERTPNDSQIQSVA